MSLLINRVRRKFITMKKYTISTILFSVILTMFLPQDNVFATDIPEKLGEVKYFLQAINTPFWIWFFRMVFCICILGILISFFYYQNKKD